MITKYLLQTAVALAKEFWLLLCTATCFWKRGALCLFRSYYYSIESSITVCQLGKLPAMQLDFDR